MPLLPFHLPGFNQALADLRYVLKTGDTMTGNLTITGTTGITLSVQSSAGTSFVVSDAQGNSALIDANTYFASAQGSLIRGQHARGTRAVPVALNQNDQVFQLLGNGYTGAAFVSCVQFQGLVTAAVPGAGDMQSLFRLRLCPAASAVAADAYGFDLVSGFQYLNGATNTLIDTNRVYRNRLFTVATLPAGVAGMRTFVNDALAPVFGAAVAGGGAITVPVYYTGAAWFVG